MALVSSLRASASNRPILWACFGGAVPFKRFSTFPQELDLFRHVKPLHDFFRPLTPNEFSVPDGFPFHISINGQKPEELRLRRMYRQERIDIDVDKVSFGRIPLLQMSGVIANKHQSIKFRMAAQPDDIRFYTINISDLYSRHVEGSEKYLETKGINPSTIDILFNYLRNRVIPSRDELPFEIKIAFEKGTLSLRRKCENEIIIVNARAVEEARVLDELADYEEAGCFKSLTQIVDELSQYDFEDDMNIFDSEELGNTEPVGDVECLVMRVSVYYGDAYSKRIKMDVFAFPDQIAIPGVTLTDNLRNSFEKYETYFKERGIDSGTMNFMIKYIKNRVEKEDREVEPMPKIFGMFDEAQMEAALSKAVKKVTVLYQKMTEGVTLNSPPPS